MKKSTLIIIPKAEVRKEKKGNFSARGQEPQARIVSAKMNRRMRSSTLLRRGT